MNRFAALASIALAASAWSAPIDRQDVPKDVLRVVSVDALLVENQIRSDLSKQSTGFLRVEVQVETRHGFHVYADRLDIGSENDPALGNPWTIAIESYPQKARFIDPVSKTLKEGYRGQSAFIVKASIPEGRAVPLTADHAVPLYVTFQACSDSTCLLPVSVRVPVALSAHAGGKREAADLSFVDRVSAAIRERLDAGRTLSPVSLALLFLAGLLTAFTPCVYPLYPITAGIFARWSRASNIGAGWLGAAYSGGLTLAYAALGVVSTVSGAVFGSLTQTPAFLLGVGGLILVSALAFSGLFEFPMPEKLKAMFSRAEAHDAPAKSGGRRVLEAFVMGAGLGIVASPCVGPALVVVLAWLSTTHAAWFEGSVLLAAYGVGMSLPFCVLAALIAKGSATPRWGRFTPVIKNLGTVVMAISSLFFLVPGFKLLGLRMTSTTAVTYPIATLDTWDKSKPTVIDFRADWCAACLELEHETFAHSSVASRFEKGELTMVRVDMTQMTPALEAVSKQYGVVSLPTVLIVQPGGAVCAPLTLYGSEGPEAFTKRLTRLATECPAR